VEAVVVILYTLFFFFLIKKWKLFDCNGISRNWLITFFGIKVLASVALYFIYTHYYTNRSEADIFKLYDASYYMYEALYTNPIDYFKMLFGFTSNEQYFHDNYYYLIDHWYREIEVNTYNDNRTLIRINAFLRFIN